MKYGVIDIGSNSVRLMLNENGKTLYKKIKTTRLAENMSNDGCLSLEAVERTVLAVSFFVNEAKEQFVDKIFVFATAAVRKAKNAPYFVSYLKDLCGVLVDVLSGEDEAKAGYLGALLSGDGAVLDVGGASTELSVVKKGNAIYSKSIYLGAVTATEKCGQDLDKVTEFTKEHIMQFNSVDCENLVAIGGTATTIASMLLQLKVYNPKKVDNFIILYDELKNLQAKVYSLSVEERKKLIGLQPERAKVIGSGITIIVQIMERFNLRHISVSESDNLEGYLRLKGEIL